MSNQVRREMTLEEMIADLPQSHRAVKELAELRADRVRLDYIESGRPGGTHWFVFSRDGRPTMIHTLHDTDKYLGHRTLRDAIDAAREANDG